MATPIKETPILYGEDSDRFLKEIAENEEKKVSRKEYDSAMKIYHKVTASNSFDGIIKKRED
ncbi:MAG: hypothetical protein NUV76_10285 [Candidatus Kuenenia sp.]|nr:hypothetical protein [Candidatus Kuenenia sp.]